MTGSGEGKSERRGDGDAGASVFNALCFCCGSITHLQSKHFEFALFKPS